MSIPKSRRQFIAGTSSAAMAIGALARHSLIAGEPEKKIPRCRLTLLPGHQTSFEHSGKEMTRWHFGPQYPRPFFYPFKSPSGADLTRMGHPGASDHDHHRSIWFAHHSVEGVDFWTENPTGRVRQKGWLSYRDGEAECIMAVRLGWFAVDPARELLEQTLVAVARPGERGEHTLELQSTFRAVPGPIRINKSNFGFLAVRVAKSVSEFFGGGRLTDSEGRQTEAGIFGRRAQWMDYSGPTADGVVEGITFFDHPRNPRSPSHWHVREDGWMCASFCMNEEYLLAPNEPLRLRYLLHAHQAALDTKKAARVLAEFTRAPFYEVIASKAKHRQFELRARPEA